MQFQIATNEKFLARRRKSRTEFQEQLQVFSSSWGTNYSQDDVRIESLARTLALPGYGNGVVDGLEVDAEQVQEHRLRLGKSPLKAT